MAELKCLILLPSRPDIFTLRSMLQNVLRAWSVTPIFLDNTPLYGAPIINMADTVRQSIESADMVIADITGSDPNIMYEVGYAHALKKPVLPILKDGDVRIPADLSGYLYYVFNPDRLYELQRVVETWVQRTSAAIPRR